MRSIAICVIEPSGNSPFPGMWPSSGTPPGVEGLTAARACNSVSGPYFGNAALSPRKGSRRESTIFAIASPLTLCCAGTEPAPMSMPSCPCWQPIWGTVRQYQRIITCTSSNRSAPRPASGSRIITVRWFLQFRNRHGGADENRTSESTRGYNPRLLHRSPSPASGDESAHHPQLPRQHCSAAAVSCSRAEEARYGARSDLIWIRPESLRSCPTLNRSAGMAYPHETSGSPLFTRYVSV